MSHSFSSESFSSSLFMHFGAMSLSFVTPDSFAETFSKSVIKLSFSLMMFTSSKPSVECWYWHSLFVQNSLNCQATVQGNLKTHQQSRHEGKKYPCDLCDFQATTIRNLITHKESPHEGKNYSCDSCDYQATSRGNLTRHK